MYVWNNFLKSSHSVLPTDQFKCKVLGLHLRKMISEGFPTHLHEPEDSFLHFLGSVEFQAGSKQPLGCSKTNYPKCKHKAAGSSKAGNLRFSSSAWTRDAALDSTSKGVSIPLWILQNSEPRFQRANWTPRAHTHPRLTGGVKHNSSMTTERNKKPKFVQSVTAENRGRNAGIAKHCRTKFPGAGAATLLTHGGAGSSTPCCSGCT